MEPENGNGKFLTGVDHLGFKLMGGFARIFGALAAKDEETYWYAIVSAAGRGFVDLAAAIGAPGVASITITQEADFIGTRFLTESVNPATGAILAPQVAGGPSWTAVIRDGSTDRQLNSDPLHGSTIAGSAYRSTPWTKNRLFRRNSTMTINFTNLQAVATRVFFAVQGYKIFDEASLDLVRRRG
jgi:hypothetical protein